MSHVTTIDFEENWENPTLKDMCAAEGWEWREGQQVFSWYGRHVGDYPLPEGFTKADMGRCDHAIRIPGARYEIGVVERNGKTHLLWDFYGVGGLPQALGNGAGKLKQAYTCAKVRREARRKNARFNERRVEVAAGGVGYREIVVTV